MKRQGLWRQAPLLAAIVLLGLATWMPPIVLPRATHSFLVVIDITQSMGVTDMRWQGHSVTRLDFAKATLRQTLRRLPCGSFVGWAAFADYRTMPLLEPLEVCEHFDALMASLDGIDPRMRWANASHVAKGLYWALRSARAFDESIVTVFVSDGHEAPPVAVGDSGSLVLEKPMTGLVVGVGQARPSPIPRSDDEGRVLAFWQADEVVQRTDVPAGSSHEELSGLAEAHLRALAERHALDYLRLVDADGLLHAMRGMPNAKLTPQPTDWRWLPAVAALVLLIWRDVTSMVRWVFARRPSSLTAIKSRK